MPFAAARSRPLPAAARLARAVETAARTWDGRSVLRVAVPVAAEDALAGGASLADAATAVTEGADPPSDLAGSSEYRAHLARVLARRALEQAAG